MSDPCSISNKLVYAKDSIHIIVRISRASNQNPKSKYENNNLSGKSDGPQASIWYSAPTNKVYVFYIWMRGALIFVHSNEKKY